MFGPPPPVLGAGSSTKGYYLGIAGDGTSYMYVAPTSTEIRIAWGSENIVRGTTSSTNGLANTNTLYAFGNAITTGHPAAYYCKTLTQGGYNTWYLPAIDELITMYSNKSATPFATSDSFSGTDYWLSSTENDGKYAFSFRMINGALSSWPKNNGNAWARPVRKI